MSWLAAFVRFLSSFLKSQSTPKHRRTRDKTKKAQRVSVVLACPLGIKSVCPSWMNKAEAARYNAHIQDTEQKLHMMTEAIRRFAIGKAPVFVRLGTGPGRDFDADDTLSMLRLRLLGEPALLRRPTYLQTEYHPDPHDWFGAVREFGHEDVLLVLVPDSEALPRMLFAINATETVGDQLYLTTLEVN